MTQYLPPNLLALFAPRDPIPYMPPTDRLPWEKEAGTYHGMAQFVAEFENAEDTPPPTRVETRDERKERKRKERAEQVAYKLEQDLALWDPSNDTSIVGDAYKTLFVGRINYDTSESKLRREFEMYGPIKRIKMIHNQKNGKPRGYAYIEYEHERDMHSAYKHADGRKIDGRRVLVDVERGRTVKGWRPRRLGGGLGSTRKGGPEVNSKYSGRDEPGKEARSRSRSLGPRRRSRSRERRRRTRSRERSRDRRRRSRSKERKKSKERDDAREERRRRRSRSRHRSRSRERKRRRSRSRDRRRSRDRTKEIKKEPEDGMNDQQYDEPNFGGVKIKEEKHDIGYDAHVAPEENNANYAPQEDYSFQPKQENGDGDGYGDREEQYPEYGNDNQNYQGEN